MLRLFDFEFVFNQHIQGYEVIIEEFGTDFFENLLGFFNPFLKSPCLRELDPFYDVIDFLQIQLVQAHIYRSREAWPHSEIAVPLTLLGLLFL